MKSIQEITYSELLLIQPETTNRFYELRAGDDIVATIDFTKDWGSLAEITTAEQTWTFKRIGFWQTKVTVRKKGEHENLAIIPYSWSKIEYISNGNKHLHLKNTSFWSGIWNWITTENQSLLEYNLSCSSKGKGIVTINNDIISEYPNWLLICLVGWYLLISMEEDASVASAAMAASTGAM